MDRLRAILMCLSLLAATALLGYEYPPGNHEVGVARAAIEFGGQPGAQENGLTGTTARTERSAGLQLKVADVAVLGGSTAPADQVESAVQEAGTCIEVAEGQCSDIAVQPMTGDADADGLAGAIPPFASSTDESLVQQDDDAALEASPQAVALDLERALIELGVDPAEARARAADFVEQSSAIESPPEELSDSGALEPSPQAVALDLERALIELGVDPDEARARASDFVEHEAPPPAPGDGDASTDAGA